MQFVTVKRISDLTGLPEKTIRRWIKERRVIASKPDKKIYMVDYDSVVELIDRRKV